MAYPPKITRPEITLCNHNFFTLAAVGFLAYYVVGMWHELLGHGLALYLYGARHFVLTSTSMHSTDEILPSGTTAHRVVEAAGSLLTILLGIALTRSSIVRFAIERIRYCAFFSGSLRR